MTEEVISTMRKIRLRNCKRVIAVLMAFLMIFSVMPTNLRSAFANEMDNSGISKGLQQLIESLSSIYGEDAAKELCQSMLSLGIIDENGNSLTYQIEMDGQFYTLDQMREIVNASEVDLTKEVKVDDISVTLEFIKKLIAFEDAMTYLDENFVNNDTTITQEHLAAMENLENQLTTDGISLNLSVTGSAISIPVVNYNLGSIYDTNKVDITYSLANFDDASKVSFTQTAIAGELGDVMDSTEHIVSLSKDVPERTETIQLPIGDEFLWNGDAIACYLHLTSLNGGKFANGKAEQLVPITRNSTFTFTIYNGSNVLYNPVPTGNVDGWTVTNGYYNNGDFGGEIKGNASKKVEASQTIFLKQDGKSLANSGQLSINASAFFWGQASSTMKIALNVNFLTSAFTIISTKSVTDSDYQVGTHKETFSISDSTVPEGTCYINLHATNDNSLTRGPAMRNFYLNMKDSVAPTLQSISAPSGYFKALEQVPIVVTYSEPVLQDSVLTLTMRDAMGKIYTAESNNTGLKSEKVTFLFTIPTATPQTLWPVSVSGGIKDIAGNAAAEYTFATDVAALATTFAYNELDSLTEIILKHEDGSALAGAYLPDETKGIIEIPLYQNSETTNDGATLGQKQNEWLISNTTVDENNNFIVNKLYASLDNGATKIPLYITDATDKLTAIFDLPKSGTHRLMLYLALDASNTAFRPILNEGYQADFVIGEIVLVKPEDMTIVYPSYYPSGIDKVLDLGAEGVKLTYTCSGEGTYKKAENFRWVSTNEDVAVIAPDGTVTTTGIGTVAFQLIANNGVSDGTKDTIVQSEIFTVRANLNNPMITTSKYILSKKGLPAPLLWSSNVTYINQLEGKNTNYSVALYEGNYTTAEELTGKSAIYTTEAALNNSITIPREWLTNLSADMIPSYTVKISTTNPYNTKKQVETVCGIIITSPPASVKIDRPASYYLLDTAEAITISWSSSDVNTVGGYASEFKITKNGELITTSSEVSGSFELNLPDITGRLKDVYTITAKIKNNDDDAYSYDSYVLNVYDAAAMKIFVDGQDQETITMDNSGVISGMTSSEIIALERKISLTNRLSINYGEYPYGLVTDQIEWNSNSSNIASINYSRGGLYNNIEDYDTTSYMPDTNFILAGLGDGTASINATHKLTRMSDTLGVTVKTLKNKLYLFQAMPMVKTEFVYTNGNNEEKTLYSDDHGAIAIYEEKGIKGDVKLRSTFGGLTYMGTIYHANLLSGENDGSKGELYPINNYVLRNVAQVNLNFQKPDGTPYTGEVTIRGGVYKNGHYCETSEISDTDHAWKKTLTITPENGSYNQLFDITRFWSAEAGENNGVRVNSSDEIKYVFEFQFEDDSYQPQIITFSGNLSGADVLRFGESIVKLVAVAPGEKDIPFYSAQYLDRYKKSGRRDNIKDYTGNIGINAQIPKLRIDTQVIWWGKPLKENANYSVSVVNETGAAIPGQTYKTFRYPFASMLVTENQAVLDKNNIWIDETGRGKVTVKSFNEDGTLYSSTLAPYSIRNMMNVENITDNEEVNKKFIAEMKSNITSQASFDATDKFTQKALNFVSNIEFSQGAFSLIVAPTADPTVFNALLQMNVGDDLGDVGPEEDGNSLMLDDDDVEKMGTAKAGFAKAREFTNSLKEELDSVADDASGLSFLYHVGGYFSCQVRYNFDHGKWEIRPIGGGISAGVGVNYSHTGNLKLYGIDIPVTYEIALGGAVQVDFDTHILYEPVNVGGIDYTWSGDKEYVADYLTNLKIKAYIYAFGGIGYDFSVAALKIGVFGQLVLENENKFLNRNYLNSAIANQNAGYNQTEKALSGSSLTLSGQIGIKVVVKLLFIKYSKTLCSAAFNKEWTFRNWDKIEAYWKATTGDMLTVESLSYAARMYALDSGLDMSVYSEEPTLEDRTYLADYERSWKTESKRTISLALSTDNRAPQELQTNAYPYSNPLIADDGQIFVYLSDNNSTDVYNTTVSYALLQGDHYVDKGAINEEASFGDTQMSFDSNEGTAIAAWTRLVDKLDKMPGDEMDSSDISLMLNNTEAYASIYKDGVWTTQRLSDNNTPDMAPIVATNGNKSIAVWRSVFSGSESDPTNFDGKDNIVYRIYDGSSWSETKTLYNGVSGNVVGLEAAMNSDGTTAVSYTVDTGEERDTKNYEMICSIVSASGEVMNNIRLTNDNYSDENSQLTVAKFDAEDERFVLGWYKDNEGKADIRLATFDKEGNLKEDFVDSLYSITSVSNISNTFRFVNTDDTANSINDLSLLWVENNASTASDSLKAVKFTQENIDGVNTTYLSAAIDVADMPSSTVIDSFDAYVSDASKDEVKVILLGTETKDEYETETLVDDDGIASEVSVPKTESKMFTAEASYQNKAAITAADYSCNEIITGFQMPITFTVKNEGKDILTSVTIHYGEDSKTFDNLKILPGTSSNLTVYYSVPEDVTDLSYAGTATFHDEEVQLTGSGSVALAVTNLGIAKINTVKEQDGQREFAATLYNSSAYKLKDSKNVVKFALYGDTTYTAGKEVSEVITVSEPDQLELIDNGAFTARLTFDLKNYLTTLGKEEIPDNGITLYLKTWVEDATGKELAEFIGDNNLNTVLCDNLIIRNGGKAVKVDAMLSNSDTKSTVELSLQNLSMKGITDGNVAVNLLDASGNIIETKYLSNTAEKLVNLDGEGLINKTFVFDKLGSDVEAYYFNASADSMNADLQLFSASGVNVNFSKETTIYNNLSTQGLTSTNITAISANANAKVVLKDKNGIVLTEQKGAIAYTLPVSSGANEFTVMVLPDGAGAETKSYSFSIENSVSAGGTVQVTSTVAQSARGWWNVSTVPVALSAKDLTNFTPVKILYKINDDKWMSKDYKAGVNNLTNLTKEGTYIINAKLQDARGYNLTADSQTIKVDRKEPAFTPGKTSAVLKDGIYHVSADVTDTGSGLYSVVMSIDGTNYTLNKKEDKNTYTAEILRDKETLVTITATDMAGNTAMTSVGKTAPANGGTDEPSIITHTPTVAPQKETVSKSKINVIAGNSGSSATAVTVDIIRRTENNKTTDTLTFTEDILKEILKLYEGKEIKEIGINTQNFEGDQADEVIVNLSKASLKLLSEKNIAFQIKAGAVGIGLSKEDLKKAAIKNQDINFNITSVRDAKEQKKINEDTLKLGIVQNYVKGETAGVYGPTRIIDSNYSGQIAKVALSLEGIKLPTDAGQRSSFINNLAVLVKHSDGSNELLRGNIVYDTKKNPIAIEVEVSKFSSFTFVSSMNTKPAASKVKISGKTTLGSKLTGSYTYSDADKDAQESSSYCWYRADSAAGKNKIKITGANKLTYQITAKDQGKYLILEIIPKAKAGVIAGDSITKAIKIPANAAPKATKLKISGVAKVGGKLTVTYVYSDTDQDKEGKTQIQWYRAEDADRKKLTLIKGAASKTYTLTKKDLGKYIICKITPAAKTGSKKGSPAVVTTKLKVK